MGERKHETALPAKPIMANYGFFKRSMKAVHFFDKDPPVLQGHN
jgi:hypothetical protein